jgi:hypothetical protein
VTQVCWGPMLQQLHLYPAVIPLLVVAFCCGPSVVAHLLWLI